MNTTPQNQQVENVSAFPPPPPFYKLYLNYNKDSKPTTPLIETEPSNNNIDTNEKDINNENSNENGSCDKNDEMNIDTNKVNNTTTNTITTTTINKKIELNKPLPPPLPPKVGANYVQFGQTYSTVDMLPSLDESGSKQLYPKGDIEPISELKKLNRSILFNYLQLLETLIENPTNFQSKIDDISLLFINFHHLLNSYRPHQARETLLSIMDEQIKQKTQSNESIKKALDICKESLINSFKNLNIENKITKTTPPATTTTTPTKNITTTDNNQDVNMNENNETNNVNTNWMDQLLDEMLKIN